MKAWHGRIQELLNAIAIITVIVNAAVAAWLHSMATANETRQAAQPIFESFTFVLPMVLIIWLVYSILNLAWFRRM